MHGSVRWTVIRGCGRLFCCKKLLEPRHPQCFAPSVILAALLLLLAPGLAMAQIDKGAAAQTAGSAGEGHAHATASPESKIAQAELLVQKGLLNDAEIAVREDLKDNPNSGSAHFLLGFILFREIQAQAERADPNPNAVYAAPGKSLVAVKEKNARASLAEYTSGARYQQPSAFDLKIVALDYVLLGDFVDADKWLTRSLEWNPGDAQGWYELGRTKYNENRFTEAVDAFQKCLARDPKNIKAEENLGLTYAGLGRDSEAIASYQTAIEWQPKGSTDPEAYVDLGRLLVDRNEPAQAIPRLLRATEIAPSVSEAHELLGKAYAQLNELPKAQVELEKAVNLAPQVARLHYILGQIYRKEGQTEKAKAEFDRCAALQGTRSSDGGSM